MKRELACFAFRSWVVPTAALFALVACGSRVELKVSPGDAGGLGAGGRGSGSSGPSTGPGSTTGPSGTTGSGGGTVSSTATGFSSTTGSSSTTSSTSGGGGFGTTTTGTTTGAGGGPIGTSCDSFRPDFANRWIAFDSDRMDFRRQIYVMHPDGSEVSRLTYDAFTDKEPSYSPDGNRVSFTSDRAGTSQIFLLDFVTLKASQVTKRPEGADQSSFSHSGALIAFHSGASVYVIAPDGSGERRVATGSDTFNAYFWPHFSADDAELVFDRNNEIDAARIGGGGTRMIVQNTTTMIKSPAVSPDGRDVAYNAQCFSDRGHSSVWTTPFSVNTEVCKGRRVSPPGEFDAQRAAWGSTDLLAYEQVDKSTNLATIVVVSRNAGSVPCQLTPPTSDSRNPSWSP